MKDVGTLFVRPMVDGILADRKLMTRRAIKPDGAAMVMPFIGADDKPTGVFGWCPNENVITRHIRCPYGQPGGRLWVRETFFAFGRWETRFSAKKGRDEWHFVDMTPDTYGCYLYDPPAHWEKSSRSSISPNWWRRPAIHMPRRACRLELEVTSVGVERLQAISEADAVAEGVTAGKYAGLDRANARAFSELWESINGAGSWEGNPWVWVVGFRRVE